MLTIQLAQFKQTESTATSVCSPGFLSVVSISIHPWKNRDCCRLQAEKEAVTLKSNLNLLNEAKGFLLRQQITPRQTYACRRAQTHTQRFILRFRLPHTAVFCFVLPVFYDWQRFSSMSEILLLDSQETSYMVSTFRVEIAAIVGNYSWGWGFFRTSIWTVFFPLKDVA